MHPLEIFINQTKQQRFIFSVDTKINNGVIVCLHNHEAEAKQWIAENNLEDIVSLIPISMTNSRKTIRASQTLRDVYGKKDIYIFWQKPRAIALQVTKMGISEFLFLKDPEYKKYKFDPDFLKNNTKELKSAFEILEDKESKAVFSSVIKFRITGDHNYLRISKYSEYEHPIVSPKSNEWVIDCGSANGATSFRFAELVYPFGRVIAIEPDPNNIEIIEKNLETNFNSIAHRMYLENCAVSDTVGELKFSSGNGGSSKLSSEGNTSVLVDTLDNIIKRHKLKGTGTISFDVEGFEIEALNGGKQSIQKLRPKLQISAYHKPQDIIDIAKWIDDNLSDYALFMGHHETYHTETDYYAIPRELLGSSTN